MKICLGVTDGSRTRDNRNHNPALYQLSYGHTQAYWGQTKHGATGRNRTDDARAFNATLYQLSYRGKKKLAGKGQGSAAPFRLHPRLIVADGNRTRFSRRRASTNELQR